MAYWWIQHYYHAFHTHFDMIGREAKFKGKISSVKKGDKIVYYVPKDQLITGIFKVTSDIHKLNNDPHWKGLHWVYNIKPIIKLQPPYLLLKDMLADFKASSTPFQFFPSYKINGMRLKDKTSIKISKADFNVIKNYLNQYKPQPMFKDFVTDEDLGQPEELRVMRFTPTNEFGVIALFVEFRKELGFESLEFIRGSFPDACAYKRIQDGRVTRKYIEFEYKSSGFRDHIANPNHRELKCDYIVCWEDDLLYNPVKVIELRKRLPEILKDAKSSLKK